MNGALAAYSVDLRILRRAVGSKDEVLHEALRTHRRNPERRALWSLIEGERPNVAGNYCGYALEKLCRTLGRRLPTSLLSPAPLELINSVDEEIRRLGSSLPLSGIISRGAPIRLPAIEDFPMIGYLEANEVTAERGKAKARPIVSPNRDWDSVIIEVEDWLEIAAARKTGIVGFFY